MAAQFGPPEVDKKKKLALKKAGQNINGSEKRRPKKTK